MKLEQLQEINTLLEDRIYLIACLGEIKVNGLDCISLNMSENLKCRHKIMNKLKGVNQQIGIIVYNEIVSDLQKVEKKLISHGVEIEIKEYLSGEQEATAEALRDNIPAKFDPAPIKNCVIGRPWEEGGMLDPNIKYTN